MIELPARLRARVMLRFSALVRDQATLTMYRDQKCLILLDFFEHYPFRGNVRVTALRPRRVRGRVLECTSVGIALQKVGKIVRAYTYRLRGYPSRDTEKAIKIANHFGWHMTVVEVPTADVARDFVRLAVEHRCRKKTQFENAYPLLYVLSSITETEIWTGWNADDHYGNTKKDILHQERMIRAGASAVDRKKEFDAARCAQFERKVTDPEPLIRAAAMSLVSIEFIAFSISACSARLCWLPTVAQFSG
jgi:hypothetical protein